MLLNILQRANNKLRMQPIKENKGTKKPKGFLLCEPTIDIEFNFEYNFHHVDKWNSKIPAGCPFLLAVHNQGHMIKLSFDGETEDEVKQQIKELGFENFKEKGIFMLRDDFNSVAFSLI